MERIKLGVIDQSPVREGGSAAEAVQETIELARACDSFGYHRYWLAEHHNTTGFAGSCPEVLLARLGAETQRMRIGSGGVMLPHYSCLKVAEQFRMLETLYPGRIDLGVGRAPGADPQANAALKAGPQAWPVEVFPQQTDLVRAFLEDSAGIDRFPSGHPYAHVHATPRGPGMPEMWMLGSAGDGAVIAAELGLPYAYAHFIGGDENAHLISLYHSRFKPRREGDRPRVALGVSVLVAETEAEAQRQAASRNLWVVKLLNGKAGAFPKLETALAYPYTEHERAQLMGAEGRSFTGTPDAVKARLEEKAKAWGAEEILALTITHDFAPRLNSYRLLAEAFAGA